MAEPAIARRPLLDEAIVAAYRRRRIADALARRCAGPGYGSTTVSDICREAGIARNTVYQHFASKEEILLELLDSAFAELIADVDAACALEGADPERRIEAALATVLDWVAAEPARASACLVDAPRATPLALHRHLAALERFGDSLRATVAAAPRRPASLEEMLVGGVAAILRGLLLAGDSARAPELLSELNDFVWLPYGERVAAPSSG